MRNVATGPKKIDTIHHFRPLLPFVWARPAFMRERVNQPTAYSPVSRIIINSNSIVAWRLERLLCIKLQQIELTNRTQTSSPFEECQMQRFCPQTRGYNRGCERHPING